MRFYEYEAKALFSRHGLPLGKSERVARDDVAEALSFRVLSAA